jgi:uncharacterized RDD family membrane protein YckC
MKKVSSTKRVIADLIDGVILISIKLVIAGAFAALDFQFKRFEEFGQILSISLWIFYLIVITTVFFAYYIYFFVRYGASPGKMLFNLVVVDNKTGKGLSIRQAIFRCIGYLVSGLPLYFGIIWILIDKNRRGWHDKIAGTQVVYGTGN